MKTFKEIAERLNDRYVFKQEMFGKDDFSKDVKRGIDGEIIALKWVLEME
jgi:hypothetical protein